MAAAARETGDMSLKHYLVQIDATEPIGWVTVEAEGPLVPS